MNTKHKVYQRLCDISGIEIENDSQTLSDDLGLDSLNMVLLLLDLEDTFGFELNESDMNPFDLVTVADVVKLAEKYEVASDGE